MGVAVHTAGGHQTSDRFLDLTLDQPNQYNPIHIDDYHNKAYNKTVFFDWRMFHVEYSQDARYPWATGPGDWNQQAVWWIQRLSFLVTWLNCLQFDSLKSYSLILS